ncbi:MAG: hypothetical protein KTR24_02625 [Saprospiraceae bacterium]|nr:hypothetical protein [Saprospiraceae bacterium]
MLWGRLVCFGIWATCLLVGCSGPPDAQLSSASKLNPNLGIAEVPGYLGKQFTSRFDRCIKVMAPNGKPIHIVAQSNITDEQMVRCRNILTHFLTDYPGSRFGHDKSAIANRMADNNAILALLDGQDDGKNTTDVPAQYLFENEIQVEGHPWYIRQDYEHRDAAYEEILHLVHDFGIGVDGPNSMPGAASAFQQEIRAAQINGLRQGIWADDERAMEWIKELAEENSLSQEYLASVIDTYYGLWGAWEEGEGGMWGLYDAKVREELPSKDSMGHALMDEAFFHPYLTYEARIDSSFSGLFSLVLDPSLPYTHHARYLKNIAFIGSHDVDIRVNHLDNNITGNKGSNAAYFSGKQEEYQIQVQGDLVIVVDQVKERDGANRLRFFEYVQFSDELVELDSLKMKDTSR